MTKTVFLDLCPKLLQRFFNLSPEHIQKFNLYRVLRSREQISDLQLKVKNLRSEVIIICFSKFHSHENSITKLREKELLVKSFENISDAMFLY